MKEKERFRQGEEARLGRRASEIARLEQELQQKRAQLLHEQKLYEENKKGWLKNQGAFLCTNLRTKGDLYYAHLILPRFYDLKICNV